MLANLDRVLRGDPRTIGYLRQGLNHEMSVVQHYITQGQLCALWGMDAECAYFRREASEELGHAAMIIRHMLALGLTPNATQLAAVRPGRDKAEFLVRDMQLEQEAVQLYAEAVDHCRRTRDETARQLFAALLKDEQAHLRELERMLADATHQESCYGGIFG
ncbi:putative Bacterioferritin [Burkholderiales bacterium GJ-E10]|nr:putative Bacterioferritin [Burkholderiales bacterium GJ-E10]